MPLQTRTPSILDVAIGYGSATTALLAAVTALLFGTGQPVVKVLVATGLTLAAALLTCASAVHRLAQERAIANDRQALDLRKQAEELMGGPR